MSVRSAFSAQESGRSFDSLASSLSGKSFITGKANKFQLKRKFYENISDFKSKVVLHKEPGFVVYRARCSFSGGVVVLKGYSRETLTLQTRQRICTEVSILQKSQCPFILKCFDSFEDQGWWWLVLENCAAGDLYHIVQENGPIWEEGWLVSQVLLPLLQTLIYLHAEGIISRDVKPEHVLFNSEKVTKLSGFFLAQDVNVFGLPKDMVGTLDYVAPEVFKVTNPEAQKQVKAGKQSGTYDYKVDVWMLGCLIYDVLVGRPPFSQETPNLTVEHILLQDPEFPDEVSDMAADFVLNCLTKDPAERPTAAQLLAHPWVRENLSWTPPEDFEDIVPDFDTEYYYAELRDDNEDASDSDSDDGVRMKWYNPMTWHILKPRGTEEFKGEGLRGGISQSVVSFAKKLVNKEETTKEDPDDVDYLEKKDLKSLEGLDHEKPLKGGNMLKPYNKVAPEKFVKDILPEEDEDEDAEDGKEEKEGASKGGNGKAATEEVALDARQPPPALNGTEVKLLRSVTEEEVGEEDGARAGPWLNDESRSKEGNGQQAGKQEGKGAGEWGTGSSGGSPGTAGAAAVNGDFYEAFVQRLSSATPREEKGGAMVAQGTGPPGFLGPLAGSALAAAAHATAGSQPAGGPNGTGGGSKAAGATSTPDNWGGGESAAAPDIPGNTDAEANGAGIRVPVGRNSSDAEAVRRRSGAGKSGAEIIGAIGVGDVRAGDTGSGNGTAQASSARGEGSGLGSARAAYGGGSAAVGRAAEVAGAASIVLKPSPRGPVLPSLGTASPRGHLPPFAQGTAPLPPSLPPGTSPRFAVPPVGSPRLSTLSTTPFAQASQPVPVHDGLFTSTGGTQAQQPPPHAHAPLGHPHLSNMVVPYAEDSSVSWQPSGQVPSPSKPASVPSGPAGTPPRASPIVPKLPLGALASQQQQEQPQQQQQQAQEPKRQGGKILDEGLLPWGNIDPGRRPQSRMAEDLVLESARARDKAGVSRSNTYEILENLPQPQRVLTSKQQQQQQQQQQDLNGTGDGVDAGTGSVLAWGFQLPMDGEGTQDDHLSPFQAPHTQSAPSHSSSHTPKHSGTSATPAMPTVVESPAVSGALPGGVSLGNSRHINNSRHVNNSSSQLPPGGDNGASNLGGGERGGIDPSSPPAAQPNSRASSTAQLCLAGPAALPRPSSIPRQNPSSGTQGPLIPPSSRYITPPPATAPVPTRSSAARLAGPLLPPEHPHNGAASRGGPSMSPDTAGLPASHAPWPGSDLEGRPDTTGVEGQAARVSPSGVPRPSSALQSGRGKLGSGGSGDSAWSAAGRGTWNSQGSSGSHAVKNGAAEPKDAWFAPAPNDRERGSGFAHNSNVERAEARLNEVHALLGPSVPNTAREAHRAGSGNSQGGPALPPGAQGWF